MSDQATKRSYTLATAAEELNLSPDTVKEVLDGLGVSSDGEISEADVTRVMEKLNSPDEPKLT